MNRTERKFRQPTRSWYDSALKPPRKLRVKARQERSSPHAQGYLPIYLPSQEEALLCLSYAANVQTQQRSFGERPRQRGVGFRASRLAALDRRTAL